MAEIAARCAACDGYGWVEQDADDAMGVAEGDAGSECAWCGGIGYVLQDERGVSRRIPEDQLAAHSETLERLELERLRQIGYSGEARKPWQQQIRLERGDRIARPPAQDDPPGAQ
ncbi:MAG: hypothetical protein JNL42_17195 [Anaerolineae bacterium]|nr:hypothetical protein [Anaerolineae bacterium]